MVKLTKEILEGDHTPKVVFEGNIASTFCVIVAEKGKLVDVSEMTSELYEYLMMVLEWRNDIFYKDDTFILITERQGYLPYEFKYYKKKKKYKKIISKIMEEDYYDKSFFVEIKEKLRVLDLAEQATL